MKIRMMSSASLLALALAVAGQPASAEEGDWFIHGRVIQIVPDESPSAFSISDKTAPDLSIGYFLTEHFALDLLLTVPQKHDISVDGEPIGSFKQLPPTLFGQWHFNPNGTWQPYVGVGVNYTAISDEKLGGPRLSDSIGPAAQIGMDVALTRNWSLSFDVKKLWIETKARQDGVEVAKVSVDPWVYGIGFGYRFGKAAPPPPAAGRRSASAAASAAAAAAAEGQRP
jgi:outer membrane protein